MRYYRVTEAGESRVVADDGTDTYDLSSVDGGPDTLADLFRAAAMTERSIDDVARARIEDAETIGISGTDVETPVRAGEVWASGVTYEISEEARQEESEDPDVYFNVYRSERPEVFMKATPSRTVGPDEEVGIRADSEWDVPEPELAVVLHDGEIVGYTVGNDVSSRSIEGENPLYLPQAKVYDRCCSFGPCVASTETIEDPHDLEMTMTIRRDGEDVYEESTNTGEMVRTCEELSSYLTRHNVVPETTVLLTGTALVPDSDFTLRPGDEVEIHIEEIGTLYNGVRTV
jgi:2-dehydro-3-deoxy-D-arabinonate dehydratase